MKQNMKVVVVGNGMVGHHFVEQLRKECPSADILVLGAEPRLAYDRVHLSEFFSGKTAKDLALTTSEKYEIQRIRFVTDAKVVDIHKKDKRVVLASGDSHPYDRLVLATGSYPFVPPIPGNDQPHCLVYRTIEDLEAIQTSAACSKVGVVIGGGLLGLEAANALKEAGLKTHVVEFAPQLMAVQLDTGSGRLLREQIEALGVEVHTDKATQVIEAGDTCRYVLRFADGSSLEADMILFSAGIRPQDELAKTAELKVGPRGGIEVDNYCKTSDDNIYAVGECALWQQRIFGLVAPGYQMARVAVSHIAGGGSTFTGADMSTKLKLLGIEVGSIGDAHGKTQGAMSYIFEDQPQQIYKKMVVSSDKKKLLGAVLVGDTQDYDTLLQYALNDMDLPDTPERLILPTADDQPLQSAVLPNSAIICSCHNVSKGDVIDAIEGGASDLPSVKSCTKASTGCGGCAALLKTTFDDELMARGVDVSTDICEHFRFSRQGLVDIIRVERIKNFDDLLEKHGKGLGCEICKPAVGSILASTWNDYVLSPDHVSLQDTNDNFLANMQKDGTYSVVPRVAGGEITPDKLITLGMVAKGFNLYCKITGGQRVDLFGARVDQLPHIWKQLIDAGFETGHAYGKALRTVKSCVGSTWCRYGVQDSVGQAISIENRYKGLRAPHKFKMAVSGCTRECAEAQSKDVGVIATENGWNLYVCGNGGMKPRHADLFATDLDTETLIKYIDRFLMFYIRTADRLQRTSVWMDKLEGGLDYLKQVVIDDSLGLASELEQQMQHIIDSYECEWARTVNDPEASKRFRQFVNSPDSDDNIVFVQERDQVRPATGKEKALRVKAQESIDIRQLETEAI